MKLTLPVSEPNTPASEPDIQLLYSGAGVPVSVSKPTGDLIGGFRAKTYCEAFADLELARLWRLLSGERF